MVEEHPLCPPDMASGASKVGNVTFYQLNIIAIGTRIVLPELFKSSPLPTGFNELLPFRAVP